MLIKAREIFLDSNRWFFQIASSKYVLWIGIPLKSNSGRQRSRVRVRARMLSCSKDFTWVAEDAN